MNPPSWKDLRSHLSALHRAALAAADPDAAVRRHLRLDGDLVHAGDRVHRLDPGSRVLMIAFGKASLAMARGALAAIGERISGGIVAHPEGVDPGAGWPPTIRLLAGGHPLPTEGSLEAGERVVELLRDLSPADVVLALVSGGGSAMLEKLPPGLTLADLGELTAALQRAGADITEINTVRRSLSLLKGGGLARLAAPAATITLLLSDVLGDQLEAIASGPTVPSPTGPGDALRVLERYNMRDRFPAAVRVIESQARTPGVPERRSADVSERRATDVPERGATGVSKPRSTDVSERRPSTVHMHIIVGSNRQAALAVQSEAARLGFHPLIWTTRLRGEAREAGRRIGAVARRVRNHWILAALPACFIFGGETTVTVRGNGKGGRNQELVLGAAISIAGCERTAVLSFATDGIDGNSGGAGALATGETLRRARAAGLSRLRAFKENDTGSFFERLGDLWTTGPSGTNVNDLTIVLVYTE